MERDHLKETVRELHEKLKSGEPLDPETRDLLLQLSADIHTLAVRAESPAALEGAIPVQKEKETLLDRLLGLTKEFEESHPQLAEAIGRVASALSRIGI